MNYPIKAESLKTNDAKLGGKYRMSNVREFIALAYLLYIASERTASVDYSDGMDRPNQLKLNPSVFFLLAMWRVSLHIIHYLQDSLNTFLLLWNVYSVWVQ